MIGIQSLPVLISFMLFVIISSHDPLWLKLIPSLLVVYFLYTLINRFITILEKMIVKTITAVSILLPYYVTLAEFEWNPYIKTEMYVLPFIVLTILLSTHTWKAYKKVMSIDSINRVADCHCYLGN